MWSKGKLTFGRINLFEKSDGFGRGRYEMNDNEHKISLKKRIAHSAKECAYLAIFIALLIVSQLVLSVVPGVELVTVMFVAYAFVMGVGRGVVAATVFSLLRQVVFGIYPVVLILYLIYYNILALCFGVLGRKIRNPLKFLLLIVGLACIATICFTLLDNILTPLWYGYGERATKAYFYASLSFMIPHLICTAVSVSVLFLPLKKAFGFVAKRL